MTQPPPDLRALLDANRGSDDPDRDDRARVRGALISKLGAAAFVTGAATTATSTAVAGAVALSASRYLAVVAITGVLGAGALATLRPQPPRPARQTVTRNVAPGVTRAAPSPSAPRVTVPAPPVAAPATTVEAPRPTPQQRARAARPADEGIESVPLEEAPDLVAETAALRDAHLAMEEGDPERALRTLEGYSSRHQGGALRVEREAARLIALCRLGRARELEVSSFLTHHASSPLAGRVDRACAR